MRLFESTTILTPEGLSRRHPIVGTPRPGIGPSWSASTCGDGRSVDGGDGGMQDGGVEAFGHSVCVAENIALLIGTPVGRPRGSP